MERFNIDNLIVGCGFTGITLANKLADCLGEKVLIIDVKDHIAGNCYDYFDKNGICVHQYGTHIFHTNNKRVWDYLSQFTKWYPYQHKVRGYIDGQEVPIPFNLNSIHQVFPEYLANLLEKKLIDTFGFNVKVPILELKKTGDKNLLFLAEYVYDKVFLHYTLKQWEMKPEDLDMSVTGRVPVYISRDNRYFQDKYQGIPMEGYTKLAQKMLDNPKIEVKLKTSYQDIKSCVNYKRLYYTGPIDEFFGFTEGELPYRSLKFDFVELNKPYFQSGACINYPNNYDFTRIGEYKYFLDNQSDKTVISFEYPQNFEQGKNERYYPIISKENEDLYQKYLSKAQKEKNIYFCGRLGGYKYLNMDQAIGAALELFEQSTRG